MEPSTTINASPGITTATSLSMALVPLSVDEIEDLLVIGNPSGLQYATYWGSTKHEIHNRLFESTTITLIGVFFSYFLSFVVGNFISTIIGTLFYFWSVLSPDFKARQRNWEFLCGRPLVDPWMNNNDEVNYDVDINIARTPKSSYDDDNDNSNEGLYGSIFLGRIEDVCVVESTLSAVEYDLGEFRGYKRSTDELEDITGSPYLIRVEINDDDGRELRIHACMKEEYLDMKSGMLVATILLSTASSFQYVSAMSELFLPDINCYVGDYPYLNRPEIESLLESDGELRNLLQLSSYSLARLKN